MISIVDYGMANLRSVQKALERTGFSPTITSTPSDLKKSDLLVLPGVGAFDKAVENLHDQNLWGPIETHLQQSRPFLGICLGLQLLFEGSDEGNHPGFGVFKGQCRRFKNVEPIPHMGWNEVEWSDVEDFHEPGTDQPQCFYFVHSFFPNPEDESIVVGETDYGNSFCCAARDGNVFGVQFHPEKSQYAGLDLLENYMNSLS